MKLIDIGKQPHDYLFGSQIINLPSDTPFGNFTLKWVDILSRLDEVNIQIQMAHENWEATRTGAITDSENTIFNRHRFAIEYAVTGMRRVADDLIALLWCLEQYQESRKYPEHVKPDEIGAMFKIGYLGPGQLLAPHQETLALLNSLSNAFKHSFIQSDLSRMGANEPLVIAQNMFRANQKNGAKLYQESLSSLASRYTSFFHDCREWLRQFAAMNTKDT